MIAAISITAALWALLSIGVKLLVLGVCGWLATSVLVELIDLALRFLEWLGGRR